MRELGPGNYELAGIRDARKVVAEFMAGVNDTRVVSASALCIESVAILHIEGKAVVYINLPRASIHLRPVYVGSDPLYGSFVRTGSSDIKLFLDRVRRMQARVRAELLEKA